MPATLDKIIGFRRLTLPQVRAAGYIRTRYTPNTAALAMVVVSRAGTTVAIAATYTTPAAQRFQHIATSCQFPDPMNDLPPELQGFASLLDSQPEPVRDAFSYCLCLMMVEAGKMRLVETLPGESSPVCVFESSAGDTFSVARPSMSKEQEAGVIALLREILDDEGMI